MSVAPEELVAAARDVWLANPNLPVPRRDPLVLPLFDNTPDPGGVGTLRELNKMSQPCEKAISSFEQSTGIVAALAAGLDPAEKEQVWNIGEDNTPEDDGRRVYRHFEGLSRCFCVEHGCNDHDQRLTVYDPGYRSDTCPATAVKTLVC
jgi:hypothetical protein